MVDLPEPEAPMMATSSPGSMTQVDALQGFDLDFAAVVNLA